MFLCLLKYLHSMNAKRTAFKRADISIHSPKNTCYGILSELSTFEYLFQLSKDDDFIEVYKI